MILATHALTGAVIGKNINNVWLIIITAIFMHFVFDSFRHGEYLQTIDKESTVKNTWWKVGLDLFSGLLIIFAFIFWKDLDLIKIRNILIGSFFSIFPDLLTFLYWKFKIKFLKRIYLFHSWIHRNPPYSEGKEWNLRNARNDIVISLVSIILLLFL
jgi:hypothetical protein